MDIFKNIKVKPILLRFVSVLICAAMILSSLMINAIASPEQSTVWDGSKVTALSSMAGEGTATNPYQIATAEQLAYVVSTNLKDDLFFKLVADIRINDTSKANWKDSARNWVWADIRFVGTLDGAGHTIDGLYFNGSQKRFGLFSNVGDSVIKELKFTNAYINNTTSDEGVSILVGNVAAATTFRGIYIDDTCELKAPNSKGVAAIVSRGNKNVTISHSAVLAKISGDSRVGAFFGSFSGGTITVTNSFSASAGVPLSGNRGLSKSKNNYGMVADSYNTTVLTADQMKGEAARTNMPNLNFDAVWQTVDGGYPVIRENPAYPWDGTKATTFAGGSGTEADPFIIEDGGQLYKMVADYSNTAVGTKPDSHNYFKIVKNIDLGNVQWYTVDSTSYPNSGSAYTTGFSGIVMGEGHTIYGLNNGKAAGVAGFIPVATQGAEIRDLHLVKANFPKAAWNNYAAGGFIGLARGGQDSVPVVLRGCSVRNSVIESRDASAAFVAYTQSQSIGIYNCYSVNNTISHTATSGAHTGAFLAMAGGNDYQNSIILSGSYSVDIPATVYTKDSMNNILVFENVYTSDVDYDNSVSGLKKLTNDQMKGAAAKENLVGFDFETVWKTVDNDYPVTFIYEKPDYIWDGTTATEFAGGEGTPQNPYLISNGAQLYKMVKEYTNAPTASGSVNMTTYFKLTNDIHLNDVKKSDMLNPTEASWGAKFNEWYSVSNKNVGFCGDLDGAGYTVYGLYGTNKRFVGLIPMLTDGGNVHNLNLKNSFVRGYESAGGIVGYVYGHYTLAAATVTYCTVDNVVIDGTGKQIGAVVGGCNDLGLTISNCSVTRSKVVSQNGDNPNMASGILGYGWGGTKKVINCFTDSSVHPITATTDKTSFDNVDGYVQYTNVYTAAAKNFDAAEGVTYLENDEKLKDTVARETLVGFDFDNDWSVVAGDYPVLKPDAGLWMYDTSLPGDVWSGKPARFYASGDGTKQSPFIIETAGQLALLANDAINLKTTNKYYKITHDIILNDTSKENWEDTANEWFIGKWDQAFRGKLDGGYHIISGLYLNKNAKNYDGPMYYGGLFAAISKNALIEKLGIVNSSLTFTGSDGETKFVGAFAGYVSDFTPASTDFEEYPTIRECFADTSVYLEAPTCGGMIGSTSRPFRVENSFFTGTVKSTGRGLIGYSKMNADYEEILVKNFYTADSKFAILTNPSYDNIKIENCYSSAAQDKEGLTRLFVDRMMGKAAKEYMKGFDFENVWAVRGESETPGLKGFDPAKFSNHMDPEDIMVSFETNCDQIVESIQGKAYSKLTLPVLKRDGYIFDGWYAFAELDVPFDFDYFPTFNTILYAKWTLDGLAQDFEQYEDSMYDYHDDYEYYRPTSPDYSAKYVHGGAKSMHRIGNSAENQDFLIVYEDELEVGKTYKMSFFVSTDQSGASADLSLVHLDWPDVYTNDNGVSKVTNLQNLKDGEWKQVDYTFVARSKWVALRTNGSNSLYFDDFVLYLTDEKGVDNAVVTKPVQSGSTLPNNTDEEESDDTDKPSSDKDGGKVTKKPNKTTKKPATTQDNSWIIYVCIAGAVVLAGAAVTVFIVLKRKRRK